ncbi:MAG: NUDIX domain-containing protein [Candidatus Aenigmarchaeota archaeon]|nr:NUDIX domain-containing protein [Candidatus Aenigmarchaeota archaeon]
MAEEVYDVVDAQDQVVGRATRETCHRQGLIHRAVHILIFNPRGELLLQERSQATGTFPGRLTSSASGHVAAGETYEEASRRELLEELGIAVPLERVGFVRSHDPVHMQNITVFRGIAEGPFTKEDASVEKLTFLPLEQVRQWVRATPDKFTPACRAVVALLG